MGDGKIVIKIPIPKIQVPNTFKSIRNFKPNNYHNIKLLVNNN